MELIKKYHGKLEALVAAKGVTPYMLAVVEGALVVLVLQWIL
ncbi:MAG: hypothetical protein NZ811_09050 [Gammaproteobacteria bacterium]|nr:hypothetical protein [Gammaproteobacteria bacterium]